jgi:hypothetical protein
VVHFDAGMQVSVTLEEPDHLRPAAQEAVPGELVRNFKPENFGVEAASALQVGNVQDNMVDAGHDEFRVRLRHHVTSSTLPGRYYRPSVVRHDVTVAGR